MVVGFSNIAIRHCNQCFFRIKREEQYSSQQRKAVCKNKQEHRFMKSLKSQIAAENKHKRLSVNDEKHVLPFGNKLLKNHYERPADLTISPSLFDEVFLEEVKQKDIDKQQKALNPSDNVIPDASQTRHEQSYIDSVYFPHHIEKSPSEASVQGLQSFSFAVSKVLPKTDLDSVSVINAEAEGQSTLHKLDNAEMSFIDTQYFTPDKAFSHNESFSPKVGFTEVGDIRLHQVEMLQQESFDHVKRAACLSDLNYLDEQLCSQWRSSNSPSYSPAQDRLAAESMEKRAADLCSTHKAEEEADNSCEVLDTGFGLLDQERISADLVKRSQKPSGNQDNFADHVDSDNDGRTDEMAVHSAMGADLRSESSLQHPCAALASAHEKPMSRTEPDSTNLWKSGLRAFQQLLPDLEKEPAYSVIDSLVAGIVYEDESLLCLNKPYRLACQGGPGVHHSVVKYLPEIGKHLRHSGMMHLCHRLDRDTTGLLLVAKDQETSVAMKTRFAHGEIMKIYLAVTRGVPNPMCGCIDIPVAMETRVNNSYKTITVPRESASRRQGLCNAITEYQVTKQCKSGSAALVELFPKTGRKHQLRVHMADGVNCPILGDHKYSHKEIMAPQRLPSEILHRFGLTQGKARHIPMHLHAKQIVIPDYFAKRPLQGASPVAALHRARRDLTLQAPLPEFFLRTIKLLKLK